MAESQHPDFPESFSRSDAIHILAGMAEEHSRFYDRAVVRVHVGPIENSEPFLIGKAEPLEVGE